MRAIFTLLATLTMSAPVLGQSEEAMRKIEAAKIALITERLELTPEQAQQFWPIYNEFFQKQREARSEFDQMRRRIDPKSATEEENKQLLDLGMSIKERQLELERTYSERLLGVISSRQMLNLRKAEDDFRRMLLERVRRQNMQRQKMDRLRNKNNERLQQRKN